MIENIFNKCMRLLKRRLLACSFIFLVLCGHANAVDVHITVDHVSDLSNGQKVITYTVHSWNYVNGDKNPCFDLSGLLCNWGVGWGVRGFFQGSSITDSVRVGWEQYTDQVRDKYVKKFGLPYVGQLTLSRKNNEKKICVAMMYSGLWGTLVAPGAHCVDLDWESNNSCQFTVGDIHLSHGLLSRNEVDGNRVSQKVNVRCINPATVLVRALNVNASDDVIELGDGLKSKLFVGNDPGLSGKVILVNGVSSVDFSSVLSGGERNSGYYSGAGIAVIDIL
ncbi:TPA: hypothetical protein JHJ70_003598 [Serratia marcescens]|nr:hypothetical protein [Serratia marcescens]HAV2137640.1 hypothetical protein [Serratia marcescens]